MLSLCEVAVIPHLLLISLKILITITALHTNVTHTTVFHHRHNRIKKNLLTLKMFSPFRLSQDFPLHSKVIIKLLNNQLFASFFAPV